MTTIDVYEKVRRALELPAAPSSDFDLNPDLDLPPKRALRPAGVLIGLVDTDRGVQVILTKRSSALKHHPGQIAFPGGKVDDADDGAVAAALREADEEIGLAPNNVEVLGTMAPHETVTNFSVTPVLARVKQEFVARPEPGEVAEVFRVPFAHVTDPDRFQVQGRFWRGTRRRYYAVPYGPYYIWGATARIFRSLADRMTA